MENIKQQKKADKETAATAEWRQRMEDWKTSGLTQQAYCQEHQLSRYAFQYWRKRLNGRPAKRRLVEVPLPLSAGQATIEIQIGERLRLSVPEGIRSEHLKAVLSVVAEL